MNELDDCTKKRHLRTQLAVAGFGIFFTVFSLMFMSPVVGEMVEQRGLEAVCAGNTVGYLIDTDSVTTTRRKDGYTRTETSYYGVYEYTVDGVEYTHKGRRGYSSPAVPETVEVHYNPNNPGEYIVEDIPIASTVLFCGVFAVAGVGIFFYAVVCYFRLKRRYGL